MSLSCISLDIQIEFIVQYTSYSRQNLKSLAIQFLFYVIVPYQLLSLHFQVSLIIIMRKHIILEAR